MSEYKLVVSSSDHKAISLKANEDGDIDLYVGTDIVGWFRPDGKFKVAEDYLQDSGFKLEAC